MSRLIPILAVLLAGFLHSASLAATPLSDRQLEELLKANAVMVYALNNGSPATCGTGTLIRGGRNMLTNLHVVSPGGRPAANFQTQLWPAVHNNRSLRISLSNYRVITNQDMISISVEGATSGFDRFSLFQDLKAGQRVATIGNRDCQPWSFSQGRILSLWRPTDPARDRRVDRLLANVSAKEPLPYNVKEHYERLIVISKFADGGSSGGPVVDAYGRLLGMMYASASDFDVVLPIEDAIRLYDPLMASSPEDLLPAAGLEPVMVAQSQERSADSMALAQAPTLAPLQSRIARQPLVSDSSAPATQVVHNPTPSHHPRLTASQPVQSSTTYRNASFTVLDVNQLREGVEKQNYERYREEIAVQLARRDSHMVLVRIEPGFNVAPYRRALLRSGGAAEQYQIQSITYAQGRAAVLGNRAYAIPGTRLMLIPVRNIKNMAEARLTFMQ